MDTLFFERPASRRALRFRPLSYRAISISSRSLRSRSLTKAERQSSGHPRNSASINPKPRKCGALCCSPWSVARYALRVGLLIVQPQQHRTVCFCCCLFLLLPTLPNARPCAGRLLNGFDQLDITFEQIADRSAKVDAFGFGAFGEPVADVGVEIDGQIEHGVFAVELAALGLAEIVFGFHVVAPLPVVFIGRIGIACAQARSRRVPR